MPARIAPIRTGLSAFIFFVSGASALSYEVIWSRTLQTVFSSNYQTAAALFSAFLLGLAIGAYLPRTHADRTNRHLYYLFMLMLCIGAYGFFAAYTFAALSQIGWLISAHDTVKILAVFVLVLPISLCFGAVWPFVTSYLASKSEVPARTIGNLYALNSFGSGLGALVTGTVLVPLLGFRGSSVLIASAAIVLSVVLYAAHLKTNRT